MNRIPPPPPPRSAACRKSTLIRSYGLMFLSQCRIMREAVLKHGFPKQRQPLKEVNVSEANHNTLIGDSQIYRKQLEEQIRRFVVHRKSGCDEWIGRYRKGYGRIWAWGKDRPVHRVLWILKNGNLPKHLFACHKCDNTKCCNLDHIFIGTAKDNFRDAIRKNRWHAASGDENGSRTRPDRLTRGEQNPSAKLTASQVIAIRSMSGTQESIARHFNVSQTLVSQIKRGLIWKHL